jgi:translation initiation factor eIF-2B subunit alpha
MTMPAVKPAAAALDVAAFYADLLDRDSSKPYPIAAIETLAQVILRSKSATMSELLRELQTASDELSAAAWNQISLSAGTALLMRFVALTLQSSSDKSFDQYKQDLAKEARAFSKASKMCAKKIVAEAATFIVDGSTILTHSYSRLVSQTLVHAATVSRKRFTVYVAEARPFGLGVKTHAELTKAGIPCTVILDSAVAYTMGKCDMVMIGAEAIAWSGGVINSIGTFSIGWSQSRDNPSSADIEASPRRETLRQARLCPRRVFQVPPPLPPLAAGPARLQTLPDFRRAGPGRRLFQRPRSQSAVAGLDRECAAGAVRDDAGAVGEEPAARCFVGLFRNWHSSLGQTTARQTSYKPSARMWCVCCFVNLRS